VIRPLYHAAAEVVKPCEARDGVATSVPENRRTQPELTRDYSSSNVDPRERMKQSENVQKPQDHTDHHHRIQDGFNRSFHRYEAIDEPQQNAHYD
jgi:hypothetical protein